MTLIKGPNMTIDVTRWLERDPDPRTREELQFLIEENLVDEIEKTLQKNA